MGGTKSPVSPRPDIAFLPDVWSCISEKFSYLTNCKYYLVSPTKDVLCGLKMGKLSPSPKVRKVRPRSTLLFAAHLPHLVPLPHCLTHLNPNPELRFVISTKNRQTPTFRFIPSHRVLPSPNLDGSGHLFLSGEELQRGGAGVQRGARLHRRNARPEAHRKLRKEGRFWVQGFLRKHQGHPPALQLSGSHP